MRQDCRVGLLASPNQNPDSAKQESHQPSDEGSIHADELKVSANLIFDSWDGLVGLPTVDRPVHKILDTVPMPPGSNSFAVSCKTSSILS